MIDSEALGSTGRMAQMRLVICLFLLFSSAAFAQDYDGGYEWAEENDTSDFDDCDTEFGAGGAEDGCNDYVRDNHSGNSTFHGYECTEDCSGHKAGFEWAEENDISDVDDCGGNSQSFIEGCEAYVEENR